MQFVKTTSRLMTGSHTDRSWNDCTISIVFISSPLEYLVAKQVLQSCRIWQVFSWKFIGYLVTKASHCNFTENSTFFKFSKIWDVYLNLIETPCILECLLFTNNLLRLFMAHWPSKIWHSNYLMYLKTIIHEPGK